MAFSVLDVNSKLVSKTCYASYYMTDPSHAMGFCWFHLLILKLMDVFQSFMKGSSLNFQLDFSCKQKTLHKYCLTDNRCSYKLSDTANLS